MCIAIQGSGLRRRCQLRRWVPPLSGSRASFAALPMSNLTSLRDEDFRQRKRQRTACFRTPRKRPRGAALRFRAGSGAPIPRGRHALSVCRLILILLVFFVLVCCATSDLHYEAACPAGARRGSRGCTASSEPSSERSTCFTHTACQGRWRRGCRGWRRARTPACGTPPDRRGADVRFHRLRSLGCVSVLSSTCSNGGC